MVRETHYLRELNPTQIMDWINEQDAPNLHFTHFDTKSNRGRPAVVSLYAREATIEDVLRRDTMFDDMKETFLSRIRTYKDMRWYHSSCLEYFEIKNNVYYCTF